MYEIVCILAMPIMLVTYYVIQRFVAHRSGKEVNSMIVELIKEAMNKHENQYGKD